MGVTSGTGTAYPSGAPEFIQLGSCYSIFSFICMFCRSLFVLLYFFFWPLRCLFFFDIWILITSLWYLQALLLPQTYVNLVDCSGVLVFLLRKTFKLFGITWLWAYGYSNNVVVCTNFDIYVFILSLGYIRLHLFISYTMYVSLNAVFF